MPKSKKRETLNRRATKTKRSENRRKNYLGKIMVVILFIIAIVGIVYIIYDFAGNSIKNFVNVFQDNKHYSTEIVKDIPNSLSNTVETNSYTPREKEVLEMIVTNQTDIKPETKTNKQKSTSKNYIDQKNVTSRSALIFYYRVSEDNLVLSSKSINIQDNNLLEVFKSLKKIKSTEKEVSFIRSNVRLIDYKVSDDILILNISDDIEFNEYGGTGVLYAIYQIAYTLGEYAKVKKVLVLIEGTKPNYISGEGIFFQNPIDITKKPKLN
ncbi:MAG: GerMN domain-containing protein [Brevinematales bacterium]|nr:GerMN domain-containing protein [Brevinematales bacterium]